MARSELQIVGRIEGLRLRKNDIGEDTLYHPAAANHRIQDMSMAITVGDAIVEGIGGAEVHPVRDH